MTTTTDPQRLANLTRLLDLIAERPTDALARELADASLLHGLITSERLDAAVLWLVNRTHALTVDALRELQHAADAELRRRATRDGG